jgi:hypothetical protein
MRSFPGCRLARWKDVKVNRKTSLPSTRFVPLAIAFLAILFFLFRVLDSTRYMSSTVDELHHLSAGYSYWMTGDFRLNPEHPPLVKLWATLPLFAGIQAPAPLPLNTLASWREGDSARFQLDYYYLQPIGRFANQLQTARLMMLVPTLLLFALLAWLGWWLEGPVGLSFVGILFALDPNLAAHGSLITTDVPASLIFTATALFAGLFLERPSPRNAAGLILCAALGSAVKYSLLILPVLALVMLLAGFLRQPARPLIRRLAGWGIAATLLGIACWSVLAVSYGGELRLFGFEAVRAAILSGTAPPLHSPSAWIPLPPNFLNGLARLTAHLKDGHPAFLDGVVFTHGRFDYFPRIMLYKIPLLFLAAGAVGIWMAFRRSRGNKSNLGPGHRRVLLVMIGFSGIYLLTAMVSSLNIGIRHILPIMPTLLLAAAVALTAAWSASRRRWMKRGLILALLALTSFESLRFGGDPLAYYNFLTIPDRAPYRHMSDSNLDWGQNIRRLVDRLRTYPASPEPVRTLLFGIEDPHQYGFHCYRLVSRQPLDPDALPYVIETSEGPVTPGIYAISTHSWMGYRENGREWEFVARLFARRPDDRAGETIFIHRLRPSEMDDFRGIRICTSRVTGYRLSDGTTTIRFPDGPSGGMP